VEHLKEKIMPYCFIWASFVPNGLTISRLTNGLIEGFNYYRKRNADYDILPHMYLKDTENEVLGATINYIRNINKLETPSKSHLKTPSKRQLQTPSRSQLQTLNF
jgi:hypothetical protein